MQQTLLDLSHSPPLQSSAPAHEYSPFFFFFLLLFLLLLVLAEIMHQVFNWSLGGGSRSDVNLVAVISEQTDSFEFLAVGSGNLFCRMLELPRCRRLPRSTDPFEVEVQESSVLIKSEQFCQHFFGRWGFLILIGNLQQCTVLLNGLGKKTFQASFLNASLHCSGAPLYLVAINVVFPWSLFHWTQILFSPCAKSGTCCSPLCQILSPEQHSDISVIRKFQSVGLSMGKIW